MKLTGGIEMAINSNNRNPYNQLDQYGNPINPYMQVDQYGNPINQYSQVDYMHAQYYNGNQNPYQGAGQPYGNQNPYNGSNPNANYYRTENKTKNVNQRRPQNNQAPYNQNLYNQNPYNQNPYNQTPYVGNNTKRNSRLNNQYNQNQYGSQYNQSPYGNQYNQNQYRPRSGASLMASNFMWNYGKYIGAGAVGLFGLQMLTGVNFFGWIFKIAFGRVGAIILIMAIIAKILSFFGSSLGEEVGGLLGKGKDWVNDKIKANIDVTVEELALCDAHDSGAMSIPGFTYPEKVKVYTIDGASKEICGGPHVTNTGELGNFKITKEEASSNGVRRIKAILE